MITGIEGRPGSGKSYFMVTRIIEDLRDQKSIVCNLHGVHWRSLCLHAARGNMEKARKYYSRVTCLSAKEFLFGGFGKVDLKHKEVYLDEIMMLLFSRDWQKIGKETILFLSQHRKYRCNITYITQSFDRLDKSLLEMTQTYISVRNLGMWHFYKLKLPQVFAILSYAENRTDLISKQFIRPRRAIYGLYDSYARFELGFNPEGSFHVPDYEKWISQQERGEQTGDTYGNLLPLPGRS